MKTKARVTLRAEQEVEIEVEHEEDDDPTDLTEEDQARALRLAAENDAVWEVDGAKEA